MKNKKSPADRQRRPDPDVYVLDEPSSNLDTYAIADFRQLLFTLKSQGKTIIISEHRLYYLSGLFDRVLYLKDGEIEGDYTAEEFCHLSAKQREEMGLRPLELAGLSGVEGPPQRINEAVWTIKNVSFAYKHEPETLHITETTFPSGSATAIIGHNGAGKSTFAPVPLRIGKALQGDSAGSEQDLFQERTIETLLYGYAGCKPSAFYRKCSG